MARKSLYLFLTALLGTLLFLTVHQVAYFIYIYMLGTGLATSGMSYVEFLAVEYFTLTITMMLGAWYGIWLGLYWYEKVYEEKSHRGLCAPFGGKLFSGIPEPGAGRQNCRSPGAPGGKFMAAGKISPKAGGFYAAS